ncbi:FAD binding domain-containing protein [Amycolatopsis sp. PS_44_ISF1]|uniref:FAD binding domain-containing protein n=1 Tax=Amycolatopsis sp. PS_44_ISF1 TaxID=2974917 RepID=UPI0028DFB6FE|nr:FAD binding domain-containing protein [Amycolatopsis sp. PS_44_ISF1]MDT8913861.1 FAD binding domain-containing protein [Amycolatopsis sp. PS_44_ISF1]
MDLNTVTEVLDPRQAPPWRPGDAWLAGGTYLFSEPQPHLRRLVDLGRFGWPPVRRLADGSVELSATCTITELSRFAARDGRTGLIEQCCRAFLASFKIWNLATVGGNLCNALPAGPMISLAAALEGTVRLTTRDGGARRLPVTAFVTGAGRTVLAPGELLRSVTLPAAALARRTAFRQASLHGLGRSGVLLIGTLGPEGFTLTVTASTVRPFRFGFPAPPDERELREALLGGISPQDWFDDLHGLPQWRRHLSFRFAEEIRRELGAAW